MNYRTSLKALFLFTCLLIIRDAIGQDFHYAQAAASPLNINPAQTGAFDGNERFAINFRRQWSSIPVPFLQLSGAFDHRFTDKKGRFNPWSAGFLFNFDRTGDTGLSFAQIGANLAYSHRLFPKKGTLLTIGMAGSGIQRAFKLGKLRWDDQYTLKEGYLEDLATGERFSNTNRFFADYSAGFNLHVPKDSSRTSFDVGMGVFHINQPLKNFREETPAKLDARWSARLASTLQVSKKFDLVVSLDGQFQGRFHQQLLGLSGLLHLSTKKTKELAVQFGSFYRLGDSVIPMAALHCTAWKVYFSYDINLSSLQNATMHRGGPEISLVYIIKQVPPDPFCKYCPSQL